MDPRYPQMAVLGVLLAYGWGVLKLEISAVNAVVIATVAMLTQAVGDRAVGRRFDPRSPWITTLSLCLLLRTNEPLMAAIAAMAAIGSKYLVRIDGRHLFNPAMLGLVVALASGHGWVSAGQWGSETVGAFFLASAGLAVVQRADRSDVTLAFVGVYGGLVLCRSLYLGEPLAIPAHRLQSGALLLFAFYMISDPKTTPSTRPDRLVYAALVATVAYLVQYALHRPNGLVWALFASSWMVPALRARHAQLPRASGQAHATPHS